MVSIKKLVNKWLAGISSQCQMLKNWWANKMAHLVCRHVTVNGFGTSTVGRLIIGKLVSLVEALTPILTVIALGPTSSSITISLKLLTAARASGNNVMIGCSSRGDQL